MSRATDVILNRWVFADDKTGNHVTVNVGHPESSARTPNKLAVRVDISEVVPVERWRHVTQASGPYRMNMVDLLPDEQQAYQDLMQRVGLRVAREHGYAIPEDDELPPDPATNSPPTWPLQGDSVPYRVLVLSDRHHPDWRVSVLRYTDGTCEVLGRAGQEYYNQGNPMAFKLWTNALHYALSLFNIDEDKPTGYAGRSTKG